jgi:L-lactate dehydrogenase complex protein LldG
MNDAKREHIRRHLTDVLSGGTFPGAGEAAIVSAPSGGAAAAGPLPGPRALLDVLTAELTAVGAVPHVAPGLAQATRLACELARASGTKQILTWDEPSIGLPGVLEALHRQGHRCLQPRLPAGPDARRQELQRLAEAGMGLTGADVAIAESGSLVLVCGAGRSRMASLLPPVHVAVVRVADVVPSLDACLARLGDLAALASHTVVITGPSRTADIEMTLSRGVHGPKQLHVIVVEA